jgi:hypothetical protein
LPQRQRPNLSDLSKETLERDLWALDESGDASGDAENQLSPEDARQAGEIPPPRETSKRKIMPVGELPPAKPENEERIQVNVSKARTPYRPQSQAAGQVRAEREFDDLEAWDDDEVVESGKRDQVESVAVEPPQERVVEPAGLSEEPVVEEIAAAAPEPQEQVVEDEFSPAVKAPGEPVSLRPKLGLSKVERIGLVALVGMIAAAGAMVFVYSIKRLPRESEKANVKDFPIQGEHLKVRSAKTYWRTPVTTGPEADTFRMGTQLLPVLELNVSGGPAAIRVHFKNEENSIVGDAVSRSVDDGGTVKVAATAGFDDIGMHAAYRTGESKLWTVEVFEAPSENAPSKEFKKLFEMEISTDRR